MVEVKRAGEGRSPVLFMFCRHDGSGSEVALLNHFQALQKSSIEIHAVFPRATPLEARFLEFTDSVTYFPVPRLRKSVNPWVHFAACCQAFGVFFGMRRLVKKYRINTVVVNTLPNIFAAISARILRKRLVWYVHEGEHMPQLIRRFFSALSSWLAHDIVVVCDYLKQRFYGDRPGVRVTKVPNAVPEPDSLPPAASAERQDLRHSLRKKWDVPQDVFVVLHVGALVPAKGQDRLVNVALQMKRHAARCLFLLLGEQTVRTRQWADAVKQKVRNAEASDCVRFLGYQAPHEFLLMADCFVLPSVGGEANPMTILEAVTYEVPVIASRTGGVPEMIRHEQSGLLVAPGDEAEIQEALLVMMNDAQLRRTLASRALVDLRRDFSPQRCAKTLEALLVGRGA